MKKKKLIDRIDPFGIYRGLLLYVGPLILYFLGVLLFGVE